MFKNRMKHKNRNIHLVSVIGRVAHIKVRQMRPLLLDFWKVNEVIECEEQQFLICDTVTEFNSGLKSNL